MRCHGCGAEIEIGTGERVGFRDSCDACQADLHVCLNCTFHDPSAYNECREPNAERVSDRDRSNRCEYFVPASGSDGEGSDPAAAARAKLDDLFKKP